MLHIARIMSGELTGFGSKVKKVIIDPAGKACTDGQVVHIPQRMVEDDTHNIIMQEAVLAHEVAGHHRYTDFIAWNEQVIQKIKAGREDPLLHDFVNILEDARINHLLGQDFPGSGRRLDFTHEVFMRNHFKTHADAEASGDPMTQKKQAIVAMMCEAIAGINHWSKDEKVISYMDEVRELLQNAIKQPDTKAVVKQARRLLEIFRNHDWDEQPDSTSEYSAPGGEYQYDEESGEPVEQGGENEESESMDDIERAAREQDRQGRNPEKVSKNRFNDMDEPQEPRGNTHTDPDQDWNPDENGEAGSEGEGEDGEGMGDGDDDGDGEGAGDADGEGADGEGADGEDGEGEGGSDGEGSGDGDCDGGECARGQDTDEIQLHDGEGDKADGEGERPDSSQNNAKGAGWNDGYDDANDFDDAWSDLIASAEESKTWMEKEAIDEEDDYNEDLERAVDAVQTERMTIEGHSLEVVAGASDMFHHDEFYDAMDNCTADYDATKEACASGIGDLVMEIKRQLKGRNSRNERGMRRGKIDNGKLHKGMTDGKVFRRKLIPKKVDAAAIILIDASGSMGGGHVGSRARCASEAATVFSEVMENVGVKYEVIDFNTSSGTTLRIRKAMDASLGNTEKAVISQPYSGSCNSDGFAVQWCIDRLDARKEKAKLLFVISDGQPSGPCNGMGSERHLKSVTSGCPSDIGLVGIGIAGMDCSAYYPTAVTVSDTTKLADRMLPVLRDMLRKVVQR